eukprot:6628316-Prymnesium_polylepis.1
MAHSYSYLIRRTSGPKLADERRVARGALDETGALGELLVGGVGGEKPWLDVGQHLEPSGVKVVEH